MRRHARKIACLPFGDVLRRHARKIACLWLAGVWVPLAGIIVWAVVR